MEDRCSVYGKRFRGRGGEGVRQLRVRVMMRDWRVKVVGQDLAWRGVEFLRRSRRAFANIPAGPQP